MIYNRLKLNKVFIGILIFIGGGLLGFLGLRLSAPQGLFFVTRVIDGDTIVVKTTHGLEHIRFIGVDTPEIAHRPGEKSDCFGSEAAVYTRKILDHQWVYLLPDSSTSDRDKYHRLLRYIFLKDGTLVNEKLIAEGFGFDYIYQPFQFMKQFDYLEKQARAKRKGLWSSQCSYYFD